MTEPAGGEVQAITEALLPRHLRLPALVLASAVSGALLCVAFPPFETGAIAWIALVPLFLALSQTRTVWQSALCGLAFGAVFYGYYFSFLLMYGALPWAITALYMASYTFLFGALAGPVMRVTSPAMRVLGSAGIWALIAYFRCDLSPVPFTGGDLAYSQFDQLPLIQCVSVIGHLGLNYAIAAVNASLSQALLSIMPFELIRPATDLKQWSRRAAWVTVVFYGLLIVSFVAGGVVVRTKRAPQGDGGTEVAIVQGNVPVGPASTPRDIEQSRDTYTRLHGTVPTDTPLTIWPEGAIPVYIQYHPDIMDAIAQAARHTDGHLLMGAQEFVDGEFSNSALLWNSDGEIVDRYRKMDLVVFGEFVPFRKQLSFLENYPIRQNDLTPGTERRVFEVAGLRVSPLICFEGMFPNPSREVCQAGAQVLVHIISDAWAQGTIEVVQHSRTAVFRAIESRRYLCRAASSGISAIYDPYGEELASVPVGAAGTIAYEVAPRDGLSVYHRIGNIPFAIFWLLCYIAALVNRRKEAA